MTSLYGPVAYIVHGRDDVRIRCAAADVAAHTFSYFGRRQLNLFDTYVCGHMAGPAGIRFSEHANRRADLTGSAVTALKRIALDKGRLQGV